jgi:beta-1,4-mannooligosaccharide/beta-1,4-mannosyl-N-acetylglucosamine phosphorylase
MWLSFSPDLIHWGDSHLVLDTDMCPFANEKLGPGAPPIRTDHGWLTTFHAVENVKGEDFGGWHGGWRKIYRAGLMLLDLEEPWKIRAMSQTPLLSPKAPYEVEGGFRNQVIFPGGMIHEPATDEVKIYYGAGDAVECLATAKLQQLISFCL